MQNLTREIALKEKIIDEEIQKIKDELPNLDNDEKNNALTLLSLLTESAILLVGLDDLTEDEIFFNQENVKNVLRKIDDVISVVNKNK